MEVWQTSNLRPLRLGEEKSDRGFQALQCINFVTYLLIHGVDTHQQLHTQQPEKRKKGGKKKKEERKNKRQDENIYGLPYYTGRL